MEVSPVPKSETVARSGVSSDAKIGNEASAQFRKRLVFAIAYLVVLLALFARPLVALMTYAATSDLHSHIILVPFISAYLIAVRRSQLLHLGKPAFVIGACLALAGLSSWLLGSGSYVSSLSPSDRLALKALAFVCLVAAGGFAIFGTRWMRVAAFPMAFLLFIIPLPDGLVESLETASKYASAETASWFFSLIGLPVLRDGLIFRLPRITIEVAQECSGIRSSLVLVITSLLAAHLFLQSTWRRILLVAIVIPLGVLRNGFRIMVIGWLCVTYGPHMIDSDIHHRGGPIFFALSLIPLFLILIYLRRGETRKARTGPLDSRPEIEAR